MSSQEIIAVIDIGSSSMRLLIAQSPRKGRGEWELVDKAEQPLALGRDVFRRGEIDRRTMDRAIEILKGFKELMAPYDVQRTVAIATSAVRESRNRETFVDRVLLQTGVEIRVIDGMEANQLTWLAVKDPLRKALPQYPRHNFLILEVGAGNTDLIMLRKGKVAAAHALPVGTLRFLQKMETRTPADTERLRDFFRYHAARTVKAMAHELDLTKVSKLMALGSDARLVASRLGKPLTDEMAVIPRDAFRAFMEEIESMSAEEVVARLNVPWSDAELLYPALVVFDTFVQATRAEEILVPDVSIRQGLLMNYAAGGEGVKKLFAAQIIAGTKALMKHYKADKNHAEFVRVQALKLYDALTAELGLSGQHRLFLETAALLHDIGAYIGGTSHHKHSQYIVRASDIFGLSRKDKEIVGNVLRYHRRAKPQKTHSFYMALPRADRIVVQKLAALLRVADALDRSHTQSVPISRVSVKKSKVVIHTSYRGDFSLEEMSLNEKGDLMEDVFGLKPVIRRDEQES